MTRRGEKGVSVLEIVVTVLLIALIAAIALPSVTRGVRSYKLQLAARSIAQQLNRCRRRSVSTNRQVSVRFIGSQAVLDTNSDGNFGFPITPPSLAPDDPPMAISMDGMTLVSADDPVTRTFTSRGALPLGVAPAAQTIIIRYLGRQRAIEIDPRGAVAMGPEVPAN
jgi:type II secretory pathway pseudopilin PulG